MHKSQIIAMKYEYFGKKAIYAVIKIGKGIFHCVVHRINGSLYFCDLISVPYLKIVKNKMKMNKILTY
jgi:hypothetical protein